MPLLDMWRDGSFDVFVDAGANIGTCSLVMGYHGIPTYSFEPNPQNLFYFNQSLLANPAFTIGLYPMGLGATSQKLPIFMEPGNAGNSVLNKPIHTRRISTPSHIVEITTLDQMTALRPWKRILLKMDVQGFEERALRGATGLLKRGAIKAIKTEVATDWLHGQGSSPRAIFDLLNASGFVLTRDAHKMHEFSRERFAGLKGKSDIYAFLHGGTDTLTDKLIIIPG